MNENIDLIKILKNCPKGTKLYSTIFGEVEFIECDNLYQIVVAKEDKYYYFTSQGTFIFERIKYNLGECCLFPSKDQRDWSKFSAPWYKKEKFDPMTLQPFDRVIARSTLNSKWRCTFFSHLIDDEKLVSMYVKDRLRSQGEKKIKYSLMQKGISEELIYRELDKISNDDLEDTAYNLALKKYGILRNKENDKYKLYQKLTRYLIGRGYGYDLVSRVVKKIINEE